MRAAGNGTKNGVGHGWAEVEVLAASPSVLPGPCTPPPRLLDRLSGAGRVTAQSRREAGLLLLLLLLMLSTTTRMILRQCLSVCLPVCVPFRAKGHARACCATTSPVIISRHIIRGVFAAAAAAAALTASYINAASTSVH